MSEWDMVERGQEEVRLRWRNVGIKIRNLNLKVKGVNKMPGAGEEYTLDRAVNLIRWDKFYLVDESWSNRDIKFLGEDPDGFELLLEACDMYVMNSRRVTGDRFMVIEVIFVPKYQCPQFVLGKAEIHIDPKEPVFIKYRSTYMDGINEITKLIEEKKERPITESQKVNYISAVKKVLELLREGGKRGQDDV